MKFNLKNKKILLGVTGSIAAYKAPMLVREFIAQGAEVKVMLTPSASEFVTPMTLANISRQSVIMDMFSKETQTGGAWHIHEAHNCDVMLIAPASATTMGKLANGICDSALVSVATALPPEVPLIISPAMDSTMWLSPATQRNVEILRNDGCVIIPPTDGELSSGMIGPGRFPDFGVILNYVDEVLNEHKVRYQTSVTYQKEVTERSTETLEESVEKVKWDTDYELEKLKQKQFSEMLKGKKVLITAGPTREKIDDVRYISNHSSGKMGYAIAEKAKNMGAEVTLISGPVEINASLGIDVINVESADEMYEAAIAHSKDYDAAIFSAAVADYRPEKSFTGKMKKESIGDDYEIKLVKNKDILAEFGKIKSNEQYLVGFALETDDLIENAKAKLNAKNCNMIVANKANSEKSGFGGDFNTISILLKNGEIVEFEPMKKDKCAEKILFKVAQELR
jgi:phosphopantothenoylcysteine decarboxylase/phosphopantothenate--cysteine ligase